MPNAIIRLATLSDVDTLAFHRMAMFRDMGSCPQALEDEVRSTTAAYLRVAIPSGEYVGFVATAPGGDEPIGGAGVQFRSLLPRPAADGSRVLLGRDGLVLNVYTDPAWRRQGVARALMDAIIAWAPAQGIVRLVLHASPAGRPLYESMGFVATREMIYTGPMAESGPWLGAAST